MNKKKAKAIYRIVGIGLTALCFVLSYFYRPYAYSHHLNDFHLADCYTSFFGVPIVVCLIQAFWREESEKWSIPRNVFVKPNDQSDACISFGMARKGRLKANIIYAVLIFFVWELVDGLLAKRMDWLDMIASVISGCLMYVVYRIFGFKNIGEYKE